MVAAGQTSFKVARLADGDDPALNVVKSLVVECTVDGRRQTFTGEDRQTVDLGGGLSVDPPALDVARRQIWQSGEYVFQTAGKKARQLTVALPAPREISGPWEVSFDPQRGGPEHATFDTLEDWATRPEDGIKYYSGTAAYRTSFQYDVAPPPSRAILDLGRVEVMAEVVLNGKSLGVLWKPPYRVDVTDALRPGENTLEVNVVNLWINRQIGDEQLPEDSDRNPDGTLKSWPAWLEEGKPSPTGRHTFTSWRLWKNTDPLAPSGLLGPVRIHATENVALP